MNQSLVTSAIGAVLGAVHVDERLDVDAERAALLDLGARQQHRVARVPEERMVALDLGEVGVPRDGAKRHVALDRDQRQRIVLPEPRGRGVPEVEIGVGVRSTKMRASPSAVKSGAVVEEAWTST